jgi:hypothetical protein
MLSISCIEEGFGGDRQNFFALAHRAVSGEKELLADRLVDDVSSPTTNPPLPHDGYLVGAGYVLRLTLGVLLYET